MAWRQHRLQILIVLALIAMLIAALVTFRERVIAAFTAAGCDLTADQCSDSFGRDVWWNDGFSTWSGLLTSAVVIGPIVLGVFAGGPIFTREFTRGTHVFALTQSVSRRRWWVTKIIVVALPLLAGLVALGFVSGWVDATTGYTAHHGLAASQFTTRAIIPAAHGLVAYAIAIAAAITTRSTVATLVSGLIVAGLVVAGLSMIHLHVLPPSRDVATIEETIQGTVTGPGHDDPDFVWVGSGYLAVDGAPVPSPAISPCFQVADNAARKAVGLPPIDRDAVSVAGGVVAATAAAEPGSRPEDTPEYQNAFNDAMLDCAHGKGIVAQYTDYLTGSMLWPLRWAMTGIAAILAALFLLLGAARLRAAVGKR